MSGAGWLSGEVGGVKTPIVVLLRSIVFLVIPCLFFPSGYFRTLLACAAHADCYNFPSTYQLGRTIKPRGGY